MNLNSHQELERVYREMDKRISQKIRENPSLLEIPRSNLKRWISDERSLGRVSPGLQEWNEIFSTHSVDEILRILDDDSEESDRLRHSSPFCGILTEEERQEFLHHVPSSS